jgi:L-lactate dehydrogenase complex protein LldG
MSDARSVTLHRIVAANSAPSSLSDAEAAWNHLPRTYITKGHRSSEEVLNLLQERLEDYDATVTRCRPAELTSTLETVLKVAAVHRIGILPALDTASFPPHFEFIPDDGMSPAELDKLDAVLTTCTTAIAETGTLVLQSPSQGRRALTLVPDLHICLVSTANVVETVPEAFARLQPMATLPTTFVSGPSATADIEMTRIKGVHGPRFLHVVLVEGPGNGL